MDKAYEVGKSKRKERYISIEMKILYYVHKLKIISRGFVVLNHV